MNFYTALGLVAPLYNMGLVMILVFLLGKLVLLKEKNKRVYIQPWTFLFIAMAVFFLEQLITVLKFAEVITEAAIPRWFNAIFELIIMVMVIYMLFMQLEHVDKNYKRKKGKTIQRR